MRLDGEHIIVQAYGNTQPKVMAGSIEEQAINRRVDILMRKDLPAEVKVVIKEDLPKEPVAPPVERKPLKALPVEDEPVAPSSPEIPIAPIVEDEGLKPLEPRKPLRALPVD